MAEESKSSFNISKHSSNSKLKELEDRVLALEKRVVELERESFHSSWRRKIDLLIKKAKD